MNKSHPVLSGKRLVESMRHNGYKNTTYAIAEIIDNSVEANAKHIELMCLDNHDEKTLKEIAILDDGDGMTKEELWNALTFGEGTRHKRKGIGRFGMGLPNSSISQCKRVTVYSWKKPSEIFTTYLDLDDLEKSELQEVPEPTLHEIPKIWKKHAKYLSNSGTLVVWSKLDKCPWKKSGTVMRNSEKLIGRIYRKYLAKHKLTIRMVSFTEYEDGNDIDNIRPNDPLYLTEKSSTPPPWDTKPMFQRDGERWEEIFPMEDHNGNKHNVTLRFSFVKDEVRKPYDDPSSDKYGKDPGHVPLGKHAGSNVGVSIIRADRELDLDMGLLESDSRERWWGAEVEFPTELDDVFGITNNKQDATNFSAMTKIIGGERRTERSDEDYDDDLTETQMYKLVQRINARIRPMRAITRKQRAGVRSKNAEGDMNAKLKRRHVIQGIPSTTQNTRNNNTPTQRTQLLSEDSDRTPEEIIELIKNDSRIDFQYKDLNGYQFFDVSLNGGVETIKINIEHSAYKNFMVLFDEMPKTTDPKKLTALIERAQIGAKSLLAAWACYEDEINDDKQKREVSEVRHEWGKRLEYFLTKSE